MLYSAVIVRIKYKYEQEESRVIMRDLLTMLLAQAICRHKCNYLIYSTINILSSQSSQHNSLGKYNLYHLIHIAPIFNNLMTLTI